MSNLTGGRKMILCVGILAVVFFTDVSPEEAKVLIGIVGSFSLANAVEHYSQRKG